MRHTLTTLSVLLAYADAIKFTKNENAEKFEKWAVQHSRSYKTLDERE
jgi:hypothetical protein